MYLCATHSHRHIVCAYHAHHPLPRPLSSHTQAAWKLLGDAELQHASVTPLDDAPGTQPAPTAAGGAEGAAAALDAVRARITRVRAAKRAYAHALHLDPTQGVRGKSDRACMLVCFHYRLSPV